MLGKIVRRLSAMLAFAAAVALLAGGAWAQSCPGKPETNSIVLMADWLPVTVSQGPFWEAKLSGYYAEEGLDVDIIAPANPADPIKLVARERVNFSLTYVPEVMISRDTGIPVISIATTLRKLVSGFMSLEETGLSHPSDLKGKIIGTGPKLDAQAFLDTLLDTGGLTREDIKVVDPGFAHIPLTLEKKVDATHALTYFEQALADVVLEQQGKPPVRFMHYTDFGVPQFYYQLIVANERWTQRNPNATCAFLKASMRGHADWIEGGEKSLQYVVKANDIFSEAEHKLTYDLSYKDWVGPAGELFVQEVGPWQTAQDWAMKYKLITVGSDPESYFTNEYLPK